MERLYTILYRFFNRIIVLFKGIKCGKRFIIHGHLKIKVRGQCEIGDNVYISSGIDMNPLCARNNGFICVEECARLSIGNSCAMSSPRIWAHQEIIIGNYVMMGGNVTIVDSDCHSLDFAKRRDARLDSRHKNSKPIYIEDDVFVGMNTMILKGVTIGARAVIGAGSVVTCNIPADCVAAGNPCKVIKMNEI